LLLAAVSIAAQFQDARAQVEPADSVAAFQERNPGTDTLTRTFIRPIPLVGSIDRALPARYAVTDSQINFRDYRYAGDLLNASQGVFTREFGSAGQPSDVIIQGLGFRETAFLNDGIRLNDPLSGIFNLYLYPTEQIERVEFVPGTRAFLYGLNSTGGAVNFISKSKKAIHPYSRIRYSEAAYGSSFVDGMVSQDISRGLNITAGAQHVTFGERFPNDNYDAWDGRMKVRYNLNSEINFFVSEIYNQTQTGLNGGVDVSQTPDSLRYERLQAVMHNTDSYEKITRNDLQVGAASRFLSDSDAVSTLTFYLSSNLREYRDEENRPSPNGLFIQQDHRSQWMGIKLAQHRTLTTNQVDYGAEVQSQSALTTPATIEGRETSVSIFGKAESEITDFFTLSPYLRFDSYRRKKFLAYGGDGSIRINSCFEAFGGYSHSYRFPTFQELNGTYPVISPLNEDISAEKHDLFETGVRSSPPCPYTLELKAFHRTIKDLIAPVPQTAYDRTEPYAFGWGGHGVLRGFNLSCSGRIGSFFVEFACHFLEMSENGNMQTFLPKWSGTGGAYYWDKLFENHLNLKAGFRSKYFSSFHGRQFDQQALVYLPENGSFYIRGLAKVDFVIIAHIGNAYLHFIWDNLTDRQYVMETFYPMPERQLRFGVSWDFTD